FKIFYAIRHPDRISGYARRRGRDALLRLQARDHISYYRAVMRSDAARSREAAVGSNTRESWLKIGQLQFDYLMGHGLKPELRMLEIGCGNLRAGRLFIDYLDAGSYYGIDISPDILLAAADTVAEFGLQDKLPHLTVVRDMGLAFLPHGYFDVVHAHSVFSPSPAPPPGGWPRRAVMRASGRAACAAGPRGQRVSGDKFGYRMPDSSTFGHLGGRHCN